MIMEKAAIDNIRQAVEGARQASQSGDFDSCDRGDIDEVIEAVERELQRPRPNAQTLATYLNSLARSLRWTEPAHNACMKLDAAMRGAGLPTHWSSSP